MVEGSEPAPYTHTYLPPPPGKDRSGVPVWAAAVLCVVTLAVGLIVGAVGGLAANAGDQGVGEGEGGVANDILTAGPNGDFDSFDSPPGTCLRGEAAGEDPTFDWHGLQAPCSEAHELEVFAQFEAPVPTDGEPMSYSRDDMQWFANDACVLAFDRYVRLDYDESAYDFNAVVPSDTAWRNGDRTIHCVLYDFDGEVLTASAKGSNR